MDNANIVRKLLISFILNPLFLPHGTLSADGAAIRLIVCRTVGKKLGYFPVKSILTPLARRDNICLNLRDVLGGVTAPPETLLDTRTACLYIQ